MTNHKTLLRRNPGEKDETNPQNITGETSNRQEPPAPPITDETPRQVNDEETTNRQRRGQIKANVAFAKTLS